MQKAVNFFKQYWKQTLVVILLTALLTAVFFPRNLKRLLIDEDASLKQIDLCYQNGDELTEITLTDSDLEEFSKLLSKTYVYKNPIKIEQVSAGEAFGWFIFPVYEDREEYADDTPPDGYIFTEEIISVDNNQYRIYGNNFIEQFEKYIKES